MTEPPGVPNISGLPSKDPADLGRASSASQPNSEGLSHPSTTRTGAGNYQQYATLIGTPTRSAANPNNLQLGNNETPKPISTAESETPRTKKRKRNSPTTADDTNATEILKSQKKIANYLEKMFIEIHNLNSSLGDKTKRETRAYSEKISMYKDLILENNLLSILGQVLPAPIQEDFEYDDVSMTSETVEELICSKCKKKLEDEQQLKNLARKLVEEIHLADPPSLDESQKVMILKKWPEDAFQKTVILVSNPLYTPPEGDQLLVLKTANDTAYIYKKMKETNLDLKSIIEEELLPGKIQFLENITRVRNKDSCKRVYVTCGESIDDLYLSLKELEIETRTSKNTTLSIIVADEKTRSTVRKLIEAIFFPIKSDN